MNGITTAYPKTLFTFPLSISKIPFQPASPSPPQNYSRSPRDDAVSRAAKHYQQSILHTSNTLENPFPSTKLIIQMLQRFDLTAHKIDQKNPGKGSMDFKEQACLWLRLNARRYYALLHSVGVIVFVEEYLAIICSSNISKEHRTQQIFPSRSLSFRDDRDILRVRYKAETKSEDDVVKVPGLGGCR